MSENNQKTRSERNKKQDNSNLIIKLAIGLVALLAVVFIFDFFLGGSNEDPNQIAGNSSEAETSIIIQSEESQTSESESETSEPESEESSEDESEEESEEEIREVPSSDPNVIRAFTGEWEPIGTSQSEPHVTDYNDGSADRIEIKRATAQATGVAENNIIENWIANNGEQKATATITDSSTGSIYKTYLTWVPGEGWQVTRYEELHAVIR